MKSLSVIVPAYNMENYLAKCCESMVVASELMERLEVLVVNDGSTDKTSEIGHSFERRYPGTFRVIDKENGHYGSCVNRGLAEAKGEFVKLLDADDTFDTAGFARLLRFLVEGSANGALDKIDLVLTDYCIVDKRGKTLRVVSFGGDADAAFGVDESIEGRCCSAMCVFRTRMLRDIGYRQTEGILYTDLEWGTFPMLGVRKIKYLPVVVYRYFQGREGQSISAAVGCRAWWTSLAATAETRVRSRFSHPGSTAWRPTSTITTLFVRRSARSMRDLPVPMPSSAGSQACTPQQRMCVFPTVFGFAMLAHGVAAAIYRALSFCLPVPTLASRAESCVGLLG